MAGSQGTLQDTAFLSLIVGELEAGRPVSAAFILDVRGSMPRDPGAVLALVANGRFVGTVGGGTVERMAEERLRALAAGEGTAGVTWYTHEDTAMACGGDALLGFAVLGQVHLPFFRRLAAALEACEPVWAVEDWQGESPRFSVIGADEALHGNEAVALTDAVAWFDEAKTYVEPIGVVPRAHIFGAGHVGRALAPVLASVGFVPVVYDDRPAMATPDAFPSAERLVTGDFTAIAAEAPIGPSDYVVVLTHGHVADIDVLEQVLPKRPAYVGCIGSRRKAAVARRTLVERGCEPAAVEAVHLPIGEDILAVTPAEIAVSIAAQMIRCRAERRPKRPHQR